MAYYKCGRVYTTQNSNIVVDTASGSVANFETDLALPLKSLEVDVNAVQEAGTPTPASPLPISGWSEISLYQRGANLFDKTTVVDDHYINDTTGAQRYNAGDKCTDFIEIKPEVAYFIYSEQTSGRWGAWYDKNKNYISGINTYGTKTAPANAKYARFTVVRNGNGNVDTFSVNYPSTFTTYEPYNGNTEVIELGGTYYGGHFIQDKAGHRQFEVTHKPFVFTGSENWQASTTFFYLQSGTLEDIPVQAQTLCSNGLSINPMTNRQIRLYPSYGINSQYISMSSTVSELQGYLSNGIQFLYELATPIIIDLPDGEPIITLNGTNNIYADTGDTTVKFRKIG